MEYSFGTGGYDIEFFVDEDDMSVNDAVIVCSNISYNPLDSTERSYVEIYKRSTGFEYIVTTGSNPLESFTDYYQTSLGLMRVVAHSKFVTVYSDNRWIHTFTFEDATIPLDRYVGLKTSASPSLTVTNIRSKELADWREAIFIDLESSSVNAISSVILQRPVDIYPSWDGKMAFMYDPVRDTVNLVSVGRHAKLQGDNSKACSDAIVYFTNVAVVVDRQFIKDEGFVTRIYRFPDLDQDAVTAAKVAQERARESTVQHKILCRILPQLELGDIANASYTRTGTQTSVDVDIIVEGITWKMSDGDQVMTIDGREDDGS